VAAAFIAWSAFVSVLPAKARACGLTVCVSLDGMVFSAVCLASPSGAKAAVTPGLETVDVHDVAAMAESTMTHAIVLARRAETEAGSNFNDSPVSSFPVL
jgi:hypothetical protein